MLPSTSSKAALSAKMERVIYVEGQDDAFFVSALLNEIGADKQKIGVIHLEGDGALAKEINLLIKSASYTQRSTTHLAFFLDADNDPAAKVSLLSSELNKRGIPPVEHSAIEKYDGNSRAVGAFIFPDGTHPGELEDLLLSTIAEDKRLELVTRVFDEIQNDYGPLNKRSKRLARMYMSVLSIKPCGIGRGYCEDVFNKEHPAINAARQFLRDFAAP